MTAELQTTEQTAQSLIQILTLNKNTGAALEKLLKLPLLDADNKIPAGALRIVGALSDGHIIEAGDNANGYYVRFADGTQVCWNKANFGTTSVMQNDNSHVEWTFPAAFVDDDIIVVGTSMGYASNRFVSSISDNVSATQFMIGNFSIQNMTWNLVGTTYYFYIAVGKWK